MTANNGATFARLRTRTTPPPTANASNTIDPGQPASCIVRFRLSITSVSASRDGFQSPQPRTTRNGTTTASFPRWFRA
jgi:hypothetical protein